MPPQPVIFAAMRTEANAIRKGLDRDIPIRIIGIKAQALPNAAELRSAGGIILAGFAGALDPSLKVGDIVLDTDLELPSLPFRQGRVYGSDTLVATPAAKSELFRSTGALAVDMETAAVKALAYQADIPFIGLRAITDTAEQSLDPAVFRFIDREGSVKPVALALALARQPSLVAPLMRLGRAAKIASRSLSEAIAPLWEALQSRYSSIASPPGDA